VRNWADALLFANFRTAVVKDEAKGGGERARGVGTGERVLYCEERAAFWAKNRYGLPAEIPLSWANFEAGLVRPTNETTTATARAKKKG